MKKLVFRLLIIAIFVYLLLDINDAPEYNYTTTIKSTITETEIDIPQTVNKIYKKSVEWGTVFVELGEDILAEFGVD